MELLALSKFTLESAGSILILVFALKFVRMKCKTHSGCFGDRIVVDTSNIGANDPINSLAELVV
jgi:hypothetical protein